MSKAIPTRRQAEYAANRAERQGQLLAERQTKRALEAAHRRATGLERALLKIRLRSGGRPRLVMAGPVKPRGGSLARHFLKDLGLRKEGQPEA